MVQASKVFFIVVLGFLLTVSPVFGQAEDGSIAGTVRDASGALVVGADVKVRNVATSAERNVQSGS
ncbi:MAG: carboxypeptidase-like regulatory domain-containing protein, partial [Candidatus Acidiferrales bacterium]